jgi:hypothetical protein
MGVWLALAAGTAHGSWWRWEWLEPEDVRVCLRHTFQSYGNIWHGEPNFTFACHHQASRRQLMALSIESAEMWIARVGLASRSSGCHKHNFIFQNCVCGWKLISELDVFPHVFTWRRFWISKQKFEISPVAPAVAIFILQPHWRLYQMGMIYTWGWSIYHSDRFFKEILNLATKIWNSLCHTCYSHIYPSATFWEMWFLPNRDNLYIILTTFSRRFWIWSSKLEIHSVALATAISILQPHFGKCDSYQIGIIYISFWPLFQGDSESGYQNLKFTL